MKANGLMAAASAVLLSGCAGMTCGENVAGLLVASAVGVIVPGAGAFAPLDFSGCSSVREDEPSSDAPTEGR